LNNEYHADITRVACVSKNDVTELVSAVNALSGTSVSYVPPSESVLSHELAKLISKDAAEIQKQLAEARRGIASSRDSSHIAKSKSFYASVYSLLVG